MKRLNIVGSKGKIIEVFDSPDESEFMYTVTDGRGNYALSNDNSIFWSDRSILKGGKIHGDPIKLYKGKPQLNVAKFYGKLGVYDSNILKMVAGPYDDMDDLLEDVYGEEDVLGSKTKYLEFDR